MQTDYGQRDRVVWGSYSTLQQLEELVAALNPHGIRENALREAIEVYRKVLHLNHHWHPQSNY